MRKDVKLSDLKKRIPRKGLLDPSLRKGYGQMDYRAIRKSTIGR